MVNMMSSAGGSGKYGCLFHEDCQDEELPRKIEEFEARFNLRTYALLKNYTSIIFDIEGRIYSFGRGGRGQLAHGGNKDELKPRLIESLKTQRIVQVCGSTGEDAEHTLYLNKKGEVFGCGENMDCQAVRRKTQDEEGTLVPILAPQLVRLSEAMSFICCGDLYSGVINTSKTKIFCFGYNGEGCLGAGVSGQKVAQSSPVRVTGEIEEEWRVESLCMGSGHTMALTTAVEELPRKRRIWIWGNNNYAQRGDGSKDYIDYPTASILPYFEEKSVEIKKIECGFAHCAVISVSANVFMW